MNWSLIAIGALYILAFYFLKSNAFYILLIVGIMYIVSLVLKKICSHNKKITTFFDLMAWCLALGLLIYLMPMINYFLF